MPKSITPNEKMQELHDERLKIDKQIVELRGEVRDKHEGKWTAELREKYDKLYDDDAALIQSIEDEKREVSRLQSLDQLRDNGLPRELAAGGSTAGGHEERQEVNEDDRRLALSGWVRKQTLGEMSKRETEACKRLHEGGVDFSPNRKQLLVPSLRASEFASAQRQFRDSRKFEKRAVTTTDNANWIFEEFINQLLENQLYFGPMWELAEVMITQSGNELTMPTDDDTSNEGGWVDEAATIGSSVDPTDGKITFNAYKRSSGVVRYTPEMMEDGFFDLIGYLNRKVTQRLARGTNRAFTTGDGTQANGIVTAAPLGHTTALGNAIGYQDLVEHQHSVDRAYRFGPTVGWMMNDSTVKYLRSLVVDDRPLWEPNVKAGEPDILLGDRVWVNNHMDGIGDNPSSPGEYVALYGDYSYYKIRQAGGVRLRRLVERYADTDEEAIIGFMRLDGDLADAGTGPVKKMRMLYT